MLTTNVTQLVKISVLGEIANPAMPGLPASPYMVSAEGEPLLVPAFGGLVYNVKLGDRALGWAAELIQPGVSIKASGNANTALGVFACLGNKARVVSGAASGATGIVTGKSGRFAEHVICHFEDAALDKMAPGDKIQVQAHGVGLQLAEFPDIQFKSCSPALLDALNPDVSGDGRLVVPVKGLVPSVLAGAGAGLGQRKRRAQLADLRSRALCRSRSCGSALWRPRGRRRLGQPLRPRLSARRHGHRRGLPGRQLPQRLRAGHRRDHDEQGAGHPAGGGRGRKYQGVVAG